MAKAADGPARGKAARRSRAEWAEEVAAWKRSGRTARDYARKRGISPATLLWWSSQGDAPAAGLAAASTSSARARAQGSLQGPRPGGGFLPVRVVAAAEVPERLDAEVVLTSGRRVRVTGGLTLQQFVRLVDAIEGDGAC